MSTLKGLLARHSRIALFLLALVALAWFPLVAMDFWQDDRALIFKLQHPHEKTVGLFGEGLWGFGPYRGTAAVVSPFWLLFKLNPAPYFAATIVVYFVATLAVWWLAKQLFERGDHAMVMAGLFAVSHLGADAMLRIINSFQNLLGVIGAAATLSLLLIHLKTRRLGWYLAALAAFILTLEGAFIRSGGLIVAVVAAHLFFTPWGPRNRLLRQLGLLVARLVPFLLAFNFIYEPAVAGQRTQATSDLIKLVVIEKQLTPFTALLETLGNLVVPEQLVRLAHLPYNGEVQTIVGGVTLLVLLVLTIVAWRMKPGLGRIIGFGTIATFAMFIPNWLEYPTVAYGSTHRYLSGSLVGWFAVISTLIVLASRRLRWRLAALAAIGVVGYLILNLSYLVPIVANRALPSKRFYRDLKQLVPAFPKGSLIFFDVANQPGIKERFRNFFAVGSMPDETAIAIYYGIDRYDIKIAESVDELLSLAIKQRTPVDRLYFLRYSASGLEDQTNAFRAALAQGAVRTSAGASLNPNQPTSLQFGEIFKELPSTLTFDYHFKPTITENKTSPVGSAAAALVALRQEMRLTASSQWRFGEVENASDDDPETAWLGHRIHFRDEGSETLTMQFPSPVTLGTLVWINGAKPRTPIHYRIEGSGDGRTWRNLTERTQQAAENNAIIRDDFAPSELLYLRMTILKTQSEDSPQVSELYPLPMIERSITLPAILDYLENPRDRRVLDRVGLWLKIGSGSKTLAKLTLVKPGAGRLTVQLPPGFVQAGTIAIGPLKPAGTLNIEQPTLATPSLKELEQKNLIKQFSEN